MLERTLADLDLLEVRDLRGDILHRIEEPSPSNRGPSFGPDPRPRRLATIAVALVISVAAAALVWRAFHPTGANRVPAVTPTSTVQAWNGIGDGWTELNPPPEILESSVRIWTGRELIVWGGNHGDSQDQRNTGYVFDSSTLTWRPLAPSPLSPRSSSAAVWTGREVLIWGGEIGPSGGPTLDDGAAYDPSSDTWRLIAPAPISNAPILVAWTGRELVVWGIHRLNGAGTGAAYDPSTDTWRAIPDPPIELNDIHAVWTGQEVIAFGANLSNSNRADTKVAIGAAYDPVSDAWRTIAPSELSPQWSQVVRDGDRMVAVDADLEAASYDPATDSWTVMPTLPTDDCEGGVGSLVRLPDALIATGCGQLVEMTTGSERLHLVPPDASGPFGKFGFSADLIGAGDVALALRSYPPDAGPGLFAYRPPAGTVPGVATARDVVAAFVGLRSGYPFEGEGSVPARTLREMSSLLSPEGEAAWDSSDRGLRSLWEYYTSFQVIDVSAMGDGRFKAVVEFTPYTGRSSYRETIILAPGDGLDGNPHDLVVVDATGDA